MSPDRKKVNFRIPLAYLSATENFKGGEQTTIYITMLKENLSPGCLSQEYDTSDSNIFYKNFIELSLVTMRSDIDPFLISRSQYKKYVEKDEYGYKVYWKKNDRPDPQSQIRELVVFPSNYFKRPTMVTCAREYKKGRVACSIEQIIDKNVILKYSLHPADLKDLDGINERIYAAGKKFLISSAGDKK